MNDKERKTANAARLEKITPALREKFAAVLRDLEAHGWQPIIDSHVYRTPAEQAALKRAGRSQVSYSFHNCTAKNGAPDAMAADIVDVRYQWNSPRDFWLMLGKCYDAHGLNWGGYWGLPKARRAELKRVLDTGDWGAHVSLGWDTAHGQVRGISLMAARLGRRPGA